MTPTAPDTLRGFIAALYAAAGLPEEDAALVADTLVRADMWGHSSHGVMRAPWYIDRVRAGTMKPVTEPEVLVDAGAISVIDGRDGVGQPRRARAGTEGGQDVVGDPPPRGSVQLANVGDRAPGRVPVRVLPRGDAVCAVGAVPERPRLRRHRERADAARHTRGRRPGRGGVHRTCRAEG